MKINLPLTDEENQLADEEYAATADEQKSYIKALAEKIESGEKLRSMDVAVIAAILRHFAKDMSRKRPRPAGHPPKLPDFELVANFAQMKHRDMSDNAAIEALAEQYGASVTAVKKRLGIGSSAEARARRPEVDGLLRALQSKT